MMNPYVLRELYRAGEADRHRAEVESARRAIAVAPTHRGAVPRLLASLRGLLGGPSATGWPATDGVPALRDYPFPAAAR